MFIYFIFFCSCSHDDVLKFISKTNVLALSGICEAVTSLVESSKSSGLSHFSYISAGGKENLSFLKSGVECNFIVRGKIVIFQICVHKGLGFFFDLIKISEVLYRIGISLWEPDLTLYFSRDESKTLSPIILYSTRSWDVKIVPNIMSTTLKHWHSFLLFGSPCTNS